MQTCEAKAAGEGWVCTPVAVRTLLKFHNCIVMFVHGFMCRLCMAGAKAGSGESLVQVQLHSGFEIALNTGLAIAYDALLSGTCAPRVSVQLSGHRR